MNTLEDRSIPIPRQSTLGELRDSGFAPRSIREELRSNLVQAIRRGENLFPGILGYEHTVIPAIVNGLIAGQDLLFLGERGQGKTRLARALTRFLDPWIPVLADTDIPDDPFAPVSAKGRTILSQLGEDAPIRWMPREDRFSEKLATPDTTIADLIGEIDPIKIAEGRYLNDEEALTPGLIVASNRSIFNINELPDLSERIQVGLLNILEERDVQIRGFKMRLPLDLVVVASANPEDYTNRGRIITPLKDRFGSQIRTHYPASAELEARIADQEQSTSLLPGMAVRFPDVMKQILAVATQIARQHEDVSARSGVSVRATIANFELVTASAIQRALKNGDTLAVPRISDLDACVEPMVGKIEFEQFGTESEQDIVRRIFGEAVLRVFGDVAIDQHQAPLRDAINEGLKVDIGLWTPVAALVSVAGKVPGFEVPPEYATSPEEVASWLEFTLEGMYQQGTIGRSDLGDANRYGTLSP